MFIDKNFKTEKALSRDKTRTNINSAYLETGKNGPRLIATNGHILAIVPVTMEPTDDINGKNRLGAEALKAIRKNHGQCTVKADAVEIKNGESQTAFLLGDEEFVDYKAILPDGDKTAYHAVGLDPHLLLELAEALGAKTLIELHFPKDPTGAIRVTDPANSNAVGVLMPKRLP